MNMNIAFTCVMAAMWLLCRQSDAAPELVDSVHHRLHNRPVLRGYAIDELLDEEEEDLLENKRQQFDDYGHMRFGKREKFDDYGHMRFGRRHN